MSAPRVSIPITASGAGTHVRIDTFWDDQDLVAPDPQHRLWRKLISVPVGDLPTTVLTRRLVRPMVLWYRSSGWEGNTRVTNYSTPVAVEIEAVPDVTGVALHVDEGGAVVTWEENALVDAVATEWAVTRDGEEVSLRTGPVIDAGVGSFPVPVRPGMTELVTVRLTPRDASPSDGPAVQLSRTRPLNVGTETAPENRVFTVDGHPIRAETFAPLLSAGLTLDADLILTSDGLPIRSNTFDLLRST